MRRTWGRCPHCGESVMVEVTAAEPGKILEHDCETLPGIVAKVEAQHGRKI